ncbi:HD-GYP domain-containing protein [Clostridium thailandense]|uniref:HD-GYP domain-containing protein n=1 Tax=Clostridium thailandense TaxID=2794346 RepID=A0A949WRJ1_9CLOT|nr:HD-GYP domain-containing protein [Clostridium thailandense]MBV7274056.1 HD-GYP domain-containing protein [Clostridium thailandense]
MRYVPIFCLQEGMQIGRNIYSNDGTVLLAKDVRLTSEYIKGLSKLGISGVYIEDNLSHDIQIKSIISDELRIQAVKSIKGIFNSTDNVSYNINTVENLAKNIMHEILNNKNVMVNMIDIKTFDDCIYSHSVNVAVLSSVIGISMHLENSKVEKLTASALLHDLGKVFISKDVLNKVGNFTPAEEKVYKSHPEKGYRYIKQYYNIAVTTYVGILQHHERFDGKGYPDGKKGEEISRFGRILSVCDAYDNLVTEIPNRKAYLPSDAIEYIMANNGQIFDPKIVKLFLRRVAPYPLGTILKLSNGKRVIVIDNNEECSSRPKVRDLEDNTEFDLTYDKNFSNVTIIGVENI